MGTLLSAGGKSRSSTGFSGTPLRAIDKNLVTVSGEKGLNDQLLSQITEALRTGGIGAQIPIIQQSVSNANQALGDTLTQTQGGLASSGLGRTPYGARIMAETQRAGNADIARIPTDAAKEFIGMAPQFASSLMGQILGALQKSTSRSGPYGV
jgi:hypothetical protein